MNRGWKHGAAGVMLLIAIASGPQQAAAIASCSVTANPVSFGIYDPASASPLDTAGNVQVSCSLIGLISLLVSYDILLSPGNGSYAQRQMLNVGNILGYNLYTDAARTTIWGDGTGGTSIITDGYLLGIGTVVRNYPVYGRVTAQQNVPAGTYSDTITVTINY